MGIISLYPEFLRYIEINKNQSKYTVRNYTHYLQRFAEFTGNVPPEMLGVEIIDAFRKHLAGLNLTESTQSYHLFALKSFLKYCQRIGRTTVNLSFIDVPRKKEVKLEIPTKDEIIKMLELIRIGSMRDLRDRALLELLYSTGLRVKEAANLNRQDVNFEAKKFQVKGKGGRVRMVFLSERAIYWLQLYLKFRNESLEPLFINYRNPRNESKRLSTVSIEQIVRNRAKRAGITSKFTPHTLRDCFATHLLQGGADIRAVQKFLGHSNITTTQKYLVYSDNYLEQTFRKFHA